MWSGTIALALISRVEHVLIRGIANNSRVLPYQDLLGASPMFPAASRNNRKPISHPRMLYTLPPALQLD